MGLLKKIFGAGGSPEPAARPAPAPVRINEVSPQELKARLERGDDLIVVDMRQPWEYQSGHIPGAIHLFANDIPMRSDELPRDRDLVLQCWHGNTSLQAAMYLIENGWSPERVASLEGGIAGWMDAHGPASLVKDPDPS